MYPHICAPFVFPQNNDCFPTRYSLLGLSNGRKTSFVYKALTESFIAI